MTQILRDRPHLTRSCALALGALLLAAMTAATPASAADPSAPAVGLIAGTSEPGISTHTDIVLSNVGPATVPAETRIDASVTRGGEPVLVGQVQFSINGKQFGAAVPVEAGMASLSVIQGVPGTYTISARYAGYADDALNLDASASGKAVFEVVPPGTGCVGGTTCDGTPVWGSDDDDEPSGVIVISTPYTETSPLVLPPLTLQRSATCIQDPLEYATDAPFSGISISDTREGRRPWTASVQSEDLLLDGQTATTASNQQRIDGQNVGLTHLALTSTSAAPQTISTPRPSGTGNLGLPINFTIFDNPSAEHVQGNAAGTLGLGGSPKRVIHANRGFGTSMFVGTLTITAPTNTVQGTYLGKLTFTVLGS